MAKRFVMRRLPKRPRTKPYLLDVSVDVSYDIESLATILERLLEEAQKKDKDIEVLDHLCITMTHIDGGYFGDSLKVRYQIRNPEHATEGKKHRAALDRYYKWRDENIGAIKEWEAGAELRKKKALLKKLKKELGEE
jgi:hypothetical protein